MRENTIKIQLGRYDSLGLFVPGLLVTCTCVVVALVLHAKTREKSAGIIAYATFVFDGLQRDNLYKVLTFGLILLGAAYIVGHVIDGLAGALFERVLVQKLHGFPYERILRLNEGNPRDQLTKKFYYRSIAGSSLLVPLAFSFQRYLDEGTVLWWGWWIVYSLPGAFFIAKSTRKVNIIGWFSSLTNTPKREIDKRI